MHCCVLFNRYIPHFLVSAVFREVDQKMHIGMPFMSKSSVNAGYVCKYSGIFTTKPQPFGGPGIRAKWLESSFLQEILHVMLFLFLKLINPLNICYNCTEMTKTYPVVKLVPIQMRADSSPEKVMTVIHM